LIVAVSGWVTDQQTGNRGTLLEGIVAPIATPPITDGHESGNFKIYKSAKICKVIAVDKGLHYIFAV
jgi:hypothetical protein